jgi:hypothetical protein
MIPILHVWLSISLAAFIGSRRVQAALVWLLWHLPNSPAVWLANKLLRPVPHEPIEQVCVPCHAASRIKRAQHDLTHGPHSEYCSKCGMPVNKWPRYCANKVVHVNNRGNRAGGRHKPIFW